tara:strand:+ start:292 stop:483 length:192 start_codon:yes stop_codon:yes gene_type:complete
MRNLNIGIKNMREYELLAQIKMVAEEEVRLHEKEFTITGLAEATLRVINTLFYEFTTREGEEE